MSSRRIRNGTVLVLCTAAIAAPAAQATFGDNGPPPEGAPRVGGQGAAVSPRLVPQPNRTVESTSFDGADAGNGRPPEGAPRVGGQGAAVSPRLVPQPNRTVVIDRRPIVLGSSGFDWADAGIGAAGAVGLALVGGGAVLGGTKLKGGGSGAVGRGEVPPTVKERKKWLKDRLAAGRM